MPDMITCPCCGEIEIPADSFKDQASVDQPVPLNGNPGNIDIFSDWMLQKNGRFFIRVETTLPIRRPDSPITVSTWVEVDQRTAATLIEEDEKDTIVKGEGVLAADIPGFPGSLCSLVKFTKTGEEAAILTDCNDQRLQIPAHIDHEQMLELYRQTWNIFGEVEPADPEFRQQLVKKYSEVFDRRFIVQDLQVPGPLIGTDPAQVAISPPLDTNDEAIFATVGHSEVDHVMIPPLEIIGAFRNPPEEFVEIFGDFAYVSRMFGGDSIHGFGSMITRPSEIPGTEGMTSWILGPPSILESDDFVISLNDPGGDEDHLLLLQAYPVYNSELTIAMQAGPRYVIETLLETRDPTDLLRDPIELPEDFPVEE